MRHRFLVALYSDMPEEAEIADVLASLPQSRRQEILRTMVKLGFNALYKDNPPPRGGESRKKAQYKPKKISVETKKDKTDDSMDEIKEKRTISEETNRDTSHKVDEHAITSKNEDSITTIDNHENLDESDNKKDIDIEVNNDDDNDDIDPMKKISQMFEGV